MEPALLRQPAEQGRGGVLDRNGQFRLDRGARHRLRRGTRLVSPYLRLRWRRWLTGHYLDHWLDGRGYYRIELERKVDNADQRISEDLRLLGFYTMTLLLGLISAVATLISFLFILWQLSGPMSLASSASTW